MLPLSANKRRIIFSKAEFQLTECDIAESEKENEYPPPGAFIAGRRVTPGLSDRPFLPTLVRELK